jgi:hypothetical protein
MSMGELLYYCVFFKLELHWPKWACLHLVPLWSWWLPHPFIAQGRAVTRRPGDRHVVPWWLGPYYTI